VPGLPDHDGTRVVDLLMGAGVGVATALVVVAVMRLAHRVDGQRERGWGMPGLLVAGGLAAGLLAALADLPAAGPQDVLFSGQASVPDLVEEDSAGIVLVLLAAKALAYAICLGCGFRGGPVFPAIFLGIALATLAVTCPRRRRLRSARPRGRQPPRGCCSRRSSLRRCWSAPRAWTLCRCRLRRHGSLAHESRTGSARAGHA
jgi:hypothetical protein